MSVRGCVLACLSIAILLLSGCTSGNQPAASNPTPSPAPNEPSSPPYTVGIGQWTWVGGASTINAAGSWGTLGQASPGNVPSARQGSVSWKDAAGNFWLFGGEAPNVGGYCNPNSALCNGGTNAWYNDLWRFSGGQWAWIAGSNTTDQPGAYGTVGVAAAGNAPGARYGAVGWSDAAGNFWLFGGTGYDAAGATGPLNDLWEFSAGQWTWIGGSSHINQPGSYGTLRSAASANFPGARSGALAFADASGNAWLFGGQGCDSTSDCGAALNDLWKFSASQWTWMAGENVAFPAQPGVFGTEGIPAASNSPGARWNPAGWLDASGNLWVFGGVGYNTVDSNVLELNDFWKYGAGLWSWMGGASSVVDALGTYGSEGTPGAGNIPGSRDSGMTWTDSSGNLWFFGGEGFGFTGGGFFNDLWEYSNGQWAWMSGSSIGGQWGAYGTQGTPSSANVAGARMHAVTWTDAQGNLWLFGGYGLDARGYFGDMNDLWEYQP
jgi:hypothetical protein